MRFTVLGSGDSVGTPQIGCFCPTCIDASEGARSRRLRPCFLVENENFTLLIDSGPDMRQQLLEYGVKNIDALLWTHAHWDHYGGFPEFWRVQHIIDVYGLKPVLDHVLTQFHYIYHRRHELASFSRTEIGGISLTLFEVNHPTAEPTCGVVIEGSRPKVVISGDTLPDIPERSMELMRGADVLFVDAITPGDQKVKKHMNANQALDLVGRLGPHKYYFYHLSHGYPPHEQAVREYPLAFDGLSIEI